MMTNCKCVGGADGAELDGGAVALARSLGDRSAVPGARGTTGASVDSVPNRTATTRTADRCRSLIPLEPASGLEPLTC